MDTQSRTSPWGETDDPYNPMFDETIGIKTVDGKTTSLRAAVFVDGFADPLSPDAMDTEREDLTFVFPMEDWPFVRSLTRGATITRPGYDKEYTVAEAKRDNLLGWIVVARER